MRPLTGQGFLPRVGLTTPVRLPALSAVCVALFLVACGGNTTPATNVTDTSATLNAVGTCSGGSPNPCRWYWQYGTGGGYQYTTPVQGPCGPRCNATNVPISWDVTGLAPGTVYQYQVCGQGDSTSQTVCVGPDGTGSTSQTFTTTSASSITYGYDANGRLTSVTNP